MRHSKRVKSSTRRHRGRQIGVGHAARGACALVRDLRRDTGDECTHTRACGHARRAANPLSGSAWRRTQGCVPLSPRAIHANIGGRTSALSSRRSSRSCCRRKPRTRWWSRRQAARLHAALGATLGLEALLAVEEHVVGDCNQQGLLEGTVGSLFPTRGAGGVMGDQCMDKRQV